MLELAGWMTVGAVVIGGLGWADRYYLAKLHCELSLHVPSAECWAILRQYSVALFDQIPEAYIQGFPGIGLWIVRHVGWRCPALAQWYANKISHQICPPGSRPK